MGRSAWIPGSHVWETNQGATEWLPSMLATSPRHSMTIFSLN